MSRWLHNSRLNVHKIYSPLIAAALSQWGENELVLILDTTILWCRYCLVRVSVRYRGRAIPVAWRVLKQNSASVGFATYQPLLQRVARWLPPGVGVRLLADRGFADTALFRYLKQELRWHYRIRIKGNFWVLRGSKPACLVQQFHLPPGAAVLLQGVKITKSDPYHVNLALAHDSMSREFWYIVTDQLPRDCFCNKADNP